MADHDLDPDPDLKALTRKPTPTKGADLHEDVAMLRGLPAYGFVPLWDSPWDDMAVYQVAIESKGKDGRLVIYYGRYDRTLLKSGQKNVELPGFCDGEVHPFYRHQITFTAAELMRWHSRQAERHRHDLAYESNRLVAAMAELGDRALAVTRQLEGTRKHFPYAILSRIRRVTKD